MSDITEPNFEEWAEKIASRQEEGLDCDTAFSIKQSLKQAYEQGKALGYLNGYDHGINIGWAELQDGDTKWVEDNSRTNYNYNTQLGTDDE